MFVHVSSSRLLRSGFAASCLALAACGDPKAEITPNPGTWSTTILEQTSNTCDEQTSLGPLLSTFLLDYDAGDMFQIEQGEDPDIVCDIDGTDFMCPDHEVTTFEVAGLTATLAWHRSLEGTFASKSMASGQERIDVSCTGEECDLVGSVPCAQVRTFEMNFIN